MATTPKGEEIAEKMGTDQGGSGQRKIATQSEMTDDVGMNSQATLWEHA